MPEIVNIRDEIARLDALGVLKPLLADKSTGGNILWATDAYAGRGARYAPDAEITPDLITGGENAGIIQTRAQKAAEQQSARTRRRAEVYTPLWVCRTMCDNLDAVWFRRKDGFNRIDPATGRVRFPKNRTWTAYVKSALTREKREQKNLPICGGLCDNNDGSNHYFFAQGRKRGRFFT